MILSIKSSFKRFQIYTSTYGTYRCKYGIIHINIRRQHKSGAFTESVHSDPSVLIGIGKVFTSKSGIVVESLSRVDTLTEIIQCSQIINIVQILFNRT